MQTIQEIYIDINGTNRYETITAKAQDDEARVIVINFIDNGKILLISNTATARIHIKTSIGTDFLNDCAIIDGKVQVVLKANMLVTGTSKCEIMITDVPDNQVITSAYFDLRVSGSLDSSAIEQSSDFSSLREGLKRLDSTPTLAQVNDLKADVVLLNQLISTTKVLWQGGWHMNSDHEIPLAEPINEQQTGIILVFSRYDSEPLDWGFTFKFFPKQMLLFRSEMNCIFTMSSDKFNIMCEKRLNIYNQAIFGIDGNSDTGTGSSGISYNNAAFVLRFVLGV